MINTQTTLASVSLALAGLLTGCASTTSMPITNASSNTLQANHWQLQQATNAQGQIDPQWAAIARNGQASLPLEINFLQGQMISVQNLCNTLNGRYALDGDRIRIERMASTLMACSDQGLMALEQKVGSLLPQASQWQISGTNPVLLDLQFADGQRWQLQGRPTHEALYGPSTRVFMEVAAAKVSCNHPLMPNTECLQVRSIDYDAQGLKGKIGEWQVFHGQIEGYNHRPGVRNVLRLKRFERPNPPADASRYLYVHDMTVESEQVTVGRTQAQP